jgi:integrase
MRKVTEQELRDSLAAIVGRGSPRVAVRLWRDLRQMFSWAEKRRPWRLLLIDGNPAELIRIETIVPPDYDLSNTRNRTLRPAEIRELQTIFERMDTAYKAATDRRAAARPLQPETRIALWICLSTACRIGELLLAEWKHVDFEQAIWFIPMENVKGTRDKKQEHRVCLSRFAVKQFKALQVLTGKQRWCFPSRDGKLHLDLKTISKQVGNRQQRFKERIKLRRRCHDDSLVLGGGANGEWTPHDLRRTAATMMQAIGVSPDVIDRCQNHVLAGSKVRRHYLTHEYAAETREAWTKLGAEIETILRPATTPSPSMRRRSARAASAEDAPRRASSDAFPSEIIAGPALLRV